MPEAPEPDNMTAGVEMPKSGFTGPFAKNLSGFNFDSVDMGNVQKWGGEFEGFNFNEAAKSL